jgi:hypothetical protein
MSDNNLGREIMRVSLWCAGGLGFWLAAATPIMAVDGAALKAAMNTIENAELDSSACYDAAGATITHHDITIRLDSGRLAFFVPVKLDSATHTFAAYFEGRATLQYRPTPPVERAQLSRFFKTDSLNRTVQKLVFLFDDSGFVRLKAQLSAKGTLFDKKSTKTAASMCEDMTDLSDRPYVFSLLRSIIHPGSGTFLCAYTNLGDDGDVAYVFDPNEREEVKFLKRYNRWGYNFLEQVCIYARDAVDITTSLNGRSHDWIDTKSYDITSSINQKGEYSGSARFGFVVRKPAQMIELSLHGMLAVDSVKDSAGTVSFGRYRDDKYWYSGLYLYFDRMLQPQENVLLTVWSHGEIAKRIMGEFYVTAGADWYPRYGFKQPATFDLHFKTPKMYTFVAAGKQLESRTVSDTTVSHWEVAELADNVSFSIGNIKKYEFSDTLAGSVDIYYSDELHRDFARALSYEGELTGSHMEKQVSADVINALRLFSHQFGRYPYGRMSVSEILALHGEAFPGFIHMGFPTWMRTDSWGDERMFRAHEVAHQWWGVGVGYETYHDQWLSEGFSEYSALLYLQAVQGNDAFLDKMKAFRKEVVAVREKPTDSSSETGPIILGYRTSSTTSEGDVSLMIYKKGALVLHMLRNLLIDWRTMKEDKFFSLMQEWFSSNRCRGATTEDFIKLTEKYTGEDMTWFFDQWIYGTEIPTYKFSYEIEPGAGNTFTVTGHVITEGTSPNFRMYVPLEIQIDDKRKAYIRVNIEGLDATFNLPGLPMKPKGLKLNPFESVLAEVKQ